MTDKKDLAAQDAEKALKPDAVQPEAESKQTDDKTQLSSDEVDVPPVEDSTATTELPTSEAESTPSPAHTESTEESNPATLSNEEAKIEDNDDSDDDHKDHDELNEDQHDDEVDYSSMSKEELLDQIAEISKSDEGFKKGKKIQAIRTSYDVIFDKEKEAALSRFIQDGGEEDDFDYKLDETSENFEAYHKILREKRYKNAKELEKQKENNLKLKNDLLERLRLFIDDDENTASINELRKLQDEWKSIGPVHPQHNKTLWANYNALLDLFYDHRSIYFELKELDKKKNLGMKLELCDQAEALAQNENLNEAIKRLNELHEEYKHIGPIPKEVQEETWQRFKSASDEIYQKRKEYYGHLKEEFKENFSKKSTLADQIQEYAEFSAEKIGEWNAKTKELLALQKEWDATGSMPKEQAKQINKKFWGAFKAFFRNKSAFFKTLDSQRGENLEIKQKLVDQAVELASKDDDWENTANKLKDLQKEWKDIGPVPEKQRESIYKSFKKACDTFFNKRRDHNKIKESSYDDNLVKKEAIIKQLEELAHVDDLDPEKVYELQDEYNALGFVPKKAIKSIQNKYQTALKAVVNNAKNFEEDELDELKSLISIHKIKAGPHGDQKLQRKEYSLKRKIQNLESDVSTWKNNLGFFANSKNAEKMLKEFEQKIQDAENQLIELKEELKLITYAG
ncbi:MULTISPECIES: DUF349 domain-containing protein [Reichenbachiella]|uniref:DUF349 domain-containing protein n=1 Tax=Reichenbachiella TaxID=156993 RepID=UPI000E6D2070|nr:MULTISPECIES: DUF349 domain-containing protein [Reichenbachiella]MBU2913659.1 DUF349 domain-containing protein [Reichenbachiella agariperforans]